MKRFNAFLVLRITVIILLASSCVYSLFPIYTEDKVVFIPDLQGTWVDIESNDGSDSIRFESLLLTKVELAIQPDDPRNSQGYTLAELRSLLGADELAEMLNKKEGFVLFPTHYAEVDAARYKMIIHGDSDGPEEYQVYISRLGNHLFVDAYPYETDDEYVLANTFPVHTFYKIELTHENLIITQFDLEKLYNLFKSNRIRLRHEIVEEQVLITAKPQELQKFLARYSKDDSVFEPDPLIQKRVSP